MSVSVMRGLAECGDISNECGTKSEIDDNREAWNVECEMQAERKRSREAEEEVAAKEAGEEKRRNERENEEMEAEDE